MPFQVEIFEMDVDEDIPTIEIQSEDPPDNADDEPAVHVASDASWSYLSDDPPQSAGFGDDEDDEFLRNLGLLGVPCGSPSSFSISPPNSPPVSSASTTPESTELGLGHVLWFADRHTYSPDADLNFQELQESVYNKESEFPGILDSALSLPILVGLVVPGSPQERHEDLTQPLSPSSKISTATRNRRKSPKMQPYPSPRTSGTLSTRGSVPSMGHRLLDPDTVSSASSSSLHSQPVSSSAPIGYTSYHQPFPTDSASSHRHHDESSDIPNASPSYAKRALAQMRDRRRTRSISPMPPSAELPRSRHHHSRSTGNVFQHAVPPFLNSPSPRSPAHSLPASPHIPIQSNYTLRNASFDNSMGTERHRRSSSPGISREVQPGTSGVSYRDSALRTPLEDHRPSESDDSMDEDLSSTNRETRRTRRLSSSSFASSTMSGSQPPPPPSASDSPSIEYTSFPPMHQKRASLQLDSTIGVSRTRRESGLSVFSDDGQGKRSIKEIRRSSAPYPPSTSSSPHGLPFPSSNLAYGETYSSRSSPYDNTSRRSPSRESSVYDNGRAASPAGPIYRERGYKFAEPSSPDSNIHGSTHARRHSLHLASSSHAPSVLPSEPIGRRTSPRRSSHLVEDSQRQDGRRGYDHRERTQSHIPYTDRTVNPVHLPRLLGPAVPAGPIGPRFTESPTAYSPHSDTPSYETTTHTRLGRSSPVQQYKIEADLEDREFDSDDYDDSDYSIKDEDYQPPSLNTLGPGGRVIREPAGGYTHRREVVSVGETRWHHHTGGPSTSSTRGSRSLSKGNPRRRSPTRLESPAASKPPSSRSRLRSTIDDSGSPSAAARMASAGGVILTGVGTNSSLNGGKSVMYRAVGSKNIDIASERRRKGEKKFQCHFKDCGKMFTTQQNCQIHQWKHTGAKPYRCACGYGSASRSDLRRHVGRKSADSKCEELPVDQDYLSGLSMRGAGGE